VGTAAPGTTPESGQPLNVHTSDRSASKEQTRCTSRSGRPAQQPHTSSPTCSLARPRIVHSLRPDPPGLRRMAGVHLAIHADLGAHRSSWRIYGRALMDAGSVAGARLHSIEPDDRCSSEFLGSRSTYAIGHGRAAPTPLCACTLPRTRAHCTSLCRSISRAHAYVPRELLRGERRAIKGGSPEFQVGYRA
jgi:hypothetical protein